MKIPVLFTKVGSVYDELPEADPWNITRDARSFDGKSAVIAHPPCRAWGKLRYFAKPRPDEMELARFAVAIIRRNGGILEHPASSSLWPDQKLPPLGRFDDSGHFTLSMPQNWFGHPCKKPTWFFVAGIAPKALPAVPYTLADPVYCIGTRKDRPSYLSKPQLPKSLREDTPEQLAKWLLEVAGRFERSKSPKNRDLLT